MANGSTAIGPTGVLVLAAIGAAVMSFGLLCLLLPLLRRHALAHPNARSSHKVPTPQGGGIAVVAATLVSIAAASVALPPFANGDLWVVLAATVCIAVVGAIDDFLTIPVLPRLALQALSIAVVLVILPSELRLVPVLPYWLERGALVVGLLWFVNLVNFMDGLDWMTVAEIVPVTAGLAVLGRLGALSATETLAAIVLCGAVAGFAPLNRPIAKVFLGDVGSLAIGLLTGWLLVMTALRGYLIAALLLPLYYLADATITLLRRLAGGEPVWQAHRTHYYQRATDHGLGVLAIVIRVFAVNVVLAALAAATVIWAGRAVELAALAGGAAAVAWLLFRLSRGKAA